jgi:plastocyanin
MVSRRFSRFGIWCLTAAACASVAVGVEGVASASAAPSVTPATGASVTIANYAFTPKALNITVGTIVTWTNKDSTGHNVTFKRFASPALGFGATFSHKFRRVGTFKYFCSIHPSMTGKVVVT